MLRGLAKETVEGYPGASHKSGRYDQMLASWIAFCKRHHSHSVEFTSRGGGPYVAQLPSSSSEHRRGNARQASNDIDEITAKLSGSLHVRASQLPTSTLNTAHQSVPTPQPPPDAIVSPPARYPVPFEAASAASSPIVASESSFGNSSSGAASEHRYPYVRGFVFSSMSVFMRGNSL
jgi:hypothetical protein